MDQHCKEAVRDAPDSIAGMSDEDRLRAVDMATSPRWRISGPALIRSYRPATAEALKPWYGYFCKRPCFHDEYLQTFNRDKRDSRRYQAREVERITADGVVVRCTEHSIDCLIFATGFEVGTDYSRRTGFELVAETGRHSPKNGATAFAPSRVDRPRLPQLLRAQYRPVGFTVNFRTCWTFRRATRLG